MSVVVVCCVLSWRRRQTMWTILTEVQTCALPSYFSPYFVGEASFLRSPGRCEIGHGKLAWRAIRPLMPSKDDFPYTVRDRQSVVSGKSVSVRVDLGGARIIDKQLLFRTIKQ